MKLLTIFFIFLSWTVVKAAIQSDIAGQPIIEFPTFDIPDFDFIDLSTGCGGFTDCIEYVGAVLYNATLGLIFLVTLLILLLVYITEFILLVIQIQYTGIEGAPVVVNTLLVFPFAAMIGLIIFKALRRGETATD